MSGRVGVEQTPDIEAVLAEARCQDVHGDMYTPPYCESCRSWAAHVAQALAPVLAAAVREARAAELREAADDIDQRVLGAPFSLASLAPWLRDRADRIAVDAPEGGA